jgi:two-component system cell cycle response regulator DivK
VSRLLLVEDNELNRDMLSRRLARAGFADDHRRRWRSRPWISSMPRQAGSRAAGHESAGSSTAGPSASASRDNPRLAATPIIALTAHAMAEDRDRALACRL